MKSKVFAAAFAACILIQLVSTGAANAVTYTLVSISCSTEDCSMTGTFDFNGSFSNINITLTGAVYPGSVFVSDQGSTATELFAGDNGNHYLQLSFAQPLAASGVNDAIVSGCLFETINPPGGCDCTPFLSTFGLTGVVEASVSSTPLPAALPLFATGLGVMGWLVKRRKRKNAAALAAA